MKTPVTSVISVFAFESCSDNVINSCLYAGFWLGKKTEKAENGLFAFCFLRAKGKSVQIGGSEFHCLTHPPLLIKTSSHCFYH